MSGEPLQHCQSFTARSTKPLSPARSGGRTCNLQQARIGQSLLSDTPLLLPSLPCSLTCALTVTLCPVHLVCLHTQTRNGQAKATGEDGGSKERAEVQGWKALWIFPTPPKPEAEKGERAATSANNNAERRKTTPKSFEQQQRALQRPCGTSKGCGVGSRSARPSGRRSSCGRKRPGAGRQAASTKLPVGDPWQAASA